ncbi:hypothetical protein VNO77_04062 [Canavalia gladiata]|uniref:Uncharacterized protein n=1 Tax=Canavalia gladiata TaxID=3824 RepID=A0AAN9MWQ2_CANGL
MQNIYRANRIKLQQDFNYATQVSSKSDQNGWEHNQKKKNRSVIKLLLPQSLTRSIMHSNPIFCTSHIPHKQRSIPNGLVNSFFKEQRKENETINMKSGIWDQPYRRKKVKNFIPLDKIDGYHIGQDRKSLPMCNESLHLFTWHMAYTIVK